MPESPRAELASLAWPAQAPGRPCTCVCTCVVDWAPAAFWQRHQAKMFRSFLLGSFPESPYTSECAPVCPFVPVALCEGLEFCRCPSSLFPSGRDRLGAASCSASCPWLLGAGQAKGPELAWGCQVALSGPGTLLSGQRETSIELVVSQNEPALSETCASPSSPQPRSQVFVAIPHIAAHLGDCKSEAASGVGHTKTAPPLGPGSPREFGQGMLSVSFTFVAISAYNVWRRWSHSHSPM